MAETSFQAGSKIVHIPRRFTRSSWGGTESVVLNLSDQLNVLGHDSSIWTTQALDPRPAETMGRSSVLRFSYFYPFIGLSLESKLQMDRKGGNLFSLSILWRLLREKSLSIIHLHTGNRLGAIARVVARLRRIPYVVSVHGGVLNTTASELESFKEPAKGAWDYGKILGLLLGARKVYDDADAIHCVNASEAESFRRKYPGKPVFYIPNGVDLERLSLGEGRRFRETHGIPPGMFLMGCISRIDPQKNQLLLVEAFERLAGGNPALCLLLAGATTDSGYRGKIEALVEKSRFRDRIFLLGGLDPMTGELADAFAALDLFVLPSRHEPFGIVILEAWAAGCPVIASPVGGVPSFTRDFENVLWFEEGSLENLVDRIQLVLADAPLRERISEAALREVHQSYGWPQIAQKVVEMYGCARDHRMNARGG